MSFRSDRRRHDSDCDEFDDDYDSFDEENKDIDNPDDDGHASTNRNITIPTLQIDRFDLPKMKRDSMVGLLGRRGSGKTYILWDIMQHHREIGEGVVFSGTEESNGFWKCCIPDGYIHDTYRPEIVRAMIERQHKRPKTARNDDGKPCPPAVFLVLDDMIHQKKELAACQYLRYVFLNGRQSKIFCIIAMQESTAFPPWARLQFDYIFLCHTDSFLELENIYRRFFGLVPTKELFCDIVSTTTENYRALVLDNKPQTRDLNKRLFWHRVSDIHRKSHRVGSRAYWHTYYRQKKQLEQASKGRRRPICPYVTELKNPSVHVECL